MARVIAVVPSEGVVMNPEGRSAPRFVALSDVSSDDWGLPHGYLVPDTHRDQPVFRATAGQDGQEVYGFRLGRQEAIDALRQLPDCVLLVAPTAIEILREASAGVHDLVEVAYNGYLPQA